MDAAAYAARQEADGVAAQAQAGLPKLSLSAREGVDRADQSHSARLGELLCGRPLQPVFLVYPKLGGEEDSVPLGQSPSAPRLRRSEEHTSELQSLRHLVCRLLLEKKKKQAPL